MQALSNAKVPGHTEGPGRFTGTAIASGIFLDKVGPDAAAAMRRHGRWRRWPRGTTLFVQGEFSDRLVLLFEGHVKISYFASDGREIVLAIREPGDVIGELTVLDGRARSASATALEAVEALTMTADDLRRAIEDDSGVGLVLLEVLSLHLRESDLRRIELSTHDTLGRVARRLLEIAERFGTRAGDGVRVDLPLTQQELAGWTGCSREAVSKALQLFRSTGSITTQRRGISILDPDALARHAAAV